MNNKKYNIKLHDYNDYLEFLKIDVNKNCKWIYDIIDKNSNTNKILYENKNFVLVMRRQMKPDKISTFHLLAFSKDKTIKSIRDLKPDHIPILKNMVKKSKKYIKKNYNFEEDEVEAHFHYPPTVLLLHIHFVLVNNRKFRKPIIEHSVNSVIQNLSIDPEYYKKIKMEILNES
jgi:m7GpppX diphosphatase